MKNPVLEAVKARMKDMAFAIAQLEGNIDEGERRLLRHRNQLAEARLEMAEMQAFMHRPENQES